MRERVMGIYKITNMINDNCYIGQSINVETRWRKHKEQAFRKGSAAYEYPLMRAFRKHGVENFEFKMLEVLSSDKKLLELETKWYNFFKPEYNQEIPGYSKNTFKKPVYKIELGTLKVLKRYDGISDASIDICISASGISRACQNSFKTSGGYYWCFVKDYYDGWKPKWVISERVVRRYNNVKRSVYRIDTNTLEIKSYKTSYTAFKKTGINSASIYNTCINKTITAGGYYWCYVDEYDKWKGKEIIPIDPDDKIVYKINMSTLKIVNKYKSAYTAGKKNNVNSELIRNVCSGKSSFSSGFYWCLKKDYKNWKPKKGKKNSVVFFIHYELQKIYGSMLEASRDLKYDRKSMQHSCERGLISRKGYSFKYLEDYERENGLESRYSDI